jgi:hypothetical protein
MLARDKHSSLLPTFVNYGRAQAAKEQHSSWIGKVLLLIRRTTGTMASVSTSTSSTSSTPRRDRNIGKGSPPAKEVKHYIRARINTVDLLVLTSSDQLRHDIQHDDTQHNDIQHNDIHNDIQHNDIQHNKLSVLSDTQHKRNSA